jgi:hypothetical protein
VPSERTWLWVEPLREALQPPIARVHRHAGRGEDDIGKAGIGEREHGTRLRLCITVMQCNSAEGETPTMRLTSIAHHLMPFAALAGGILVLLMPRLLNYVVAIYLILVGFIGLNSLFHFFR